MSEPDLPLLRGVERGPAGGGLGMAWGPKGSTARVEAVLEVPEPTEAQLVVDVEYVERQMYWSLATFGPGPRTEGILQHMLKEQDEIRADPTDLKEWVDQIILAFDGAWRAGHSAPEILQALHDKQDVNFGREWPDWSGFGQDQAIEHVRPVVEP